MSTNLRKIDWTNDVLKNLAEVDESAAKFIRDQRVSIGFWKQGAHTSAIWAPGKRIFFNPRYYSLKTDPRDPLVHSILIHEVRHLQQGIFTALSVYGELDAWQLGFKVYHEMTGYPYHPKLVELMSLSLILDRDVLRRAQVLMQGYAGKSYRADLLPLYPWGLELKFRLGRLK
ncbi:MAG TPA: hypothetical protein VGK00_17235 [Anaerolineales bacterium]|jgi:hypothetical protein